jgi:flagellar basal-body rod protein FlgF
MIKGIYISRAGMDPKMSKMDIIANNLANINTVGFKRDALFLRKLEDLTSERVDENGELPGLYFEQFTSYAEGAFNQTNNPLDVAIQGDGFFVIETPTGPMYTRNGNFSIAPDGTLSTGAGHPVLGDGGHITFHEPEKLEKAVLRVDENGLISLDGELAGRLRVVTFDSLRDLKKEGGYFSANNTPEIELAPGDGRFLIRQGFIEESNVDALQEMIYMIELSRNFESFQRMIQIQDSTLDQTMSVGRY